METKQLIIKIDAKLHKRFKMISANNDQTMSEVLIKAINEYCKIGFRLPMSDHEKDERARRLKLTDAISRIPRDEFPFKGVFTYTDFYRYLLAHAGKHPPLRRVDIKWLGPDNLHVMLNQKTGTGRAYKAYGDGRFSLRDEPSVRAGATDAR